MPTLYVVATPIGNLSDASARMLDTLGSVDLIAAEDTRVTGNLLRHFGISRPLISLHRHNETEKAGALVARMVEEGICVALVTDAGTPAISDPGHLLVREAAQAGIEVLAIAGPTAMAAALSVSGFDAREFAFYGFLSRERGDLKKKLLAIAKGPTVAVLHESPHRVTFLMEMVTETLPGCLACVCCDLTKKYEKTLHGEARDVLVMLQNNPKTEKGEYCVVLDLHSVTVPEEAPQVQASAEAQLMDLLLGGADWQRAIDEVCSRGMRKNEAKRAALRLRGWISSQAE